MANKITYHRTIIVGLGSTGLRILESFRSLWFERFGNYSDNLVRCINIETAIGAIPQIEGIEQIFISETGEDYKTIGNRCLTEGNPLENQVPEIPWEFNWVKDINWANDVGVIGIGGAGGIRAGGRLLLWSKHKTSGDIQAKRIYNHIKQDVNEKWKTISAVDTKTEILECLGYNRQDQNFKQFLDNVSDEMRVFVVGSLTGGTCSGTFIDIGYILQAITGIQERDCYGMFLIPKKDLLFDAKAGVDPCLTNANSFGALYELEKINDLRRREEKSKVPYGNFYIVAPEYHHPEIGFDLTLEGLVEMTAQRLFVYTLGLSFKIDEDAIDFRTNNRHTYLFTFGNSAIIYPKYTILQILANSTLKILTDKLIDKDKLWNYKENKNTDKSEWSTKKSEVIKIIDAISSDTFNRLKNNLGELRVEDIHDRWIKNITGKTDNVNNWLLEYSENRNNYMTILETNLEPTKNYAIEKIFDYLKNKYELTQNLEYIKYLVDLLKESIENIIELLKEQNCENFDEKIKNELPKLYRELLKMNLTILDQGKIIQSEIELLFEKFVHFYQLKVFMRIDKMLDDFRSKLLIVLNNLSDKTQIFDQEKDRFIGKLNHDIKSVPIVKVFVNESIKKDLEQLLNKHSKIDSKIFDDDTYKAESKLFFKNIIEYNDLDNKINIYLEKIKERFKICIQRDLTKELQEKEFNVVAKILQGYENKLISKIILNTAKGFLKTVKEESFTGRISHYLITDSEKGKELKREFGINIEDENCITLDKVRDMIIYFKDIPMRSYENIQNYKSMKEHFLSAPNESQMKDETWTRLRLTLDSDNSLGLVNYALLEPSKRNNLEKIFKFISYFWFSLKSTKNRKIIYDVINKSDYQIPNKTEDEGCYIENGQPMLKLISSNARVPIKINVINTPLVTINEIIKKKAFYDRIKTFLKENSYFGNLESDHTGCKIFLEKLENHFINKVKPTFIDTDKYSMEHENIFGTYQKDGSLFLLKNEDTVMGTLLNLLSE